MLALLCGNAVESRLAQMAFYVTHDRVITSPVFNKYLGTVDFASCELPAVELEDIVITSMPNKLTYLHGEAVDITGLVVKAKYSNDERVSVNNDELDISPKVVTTNSVITISYTNQGITKSVVVPIDVTAENFQPCVPLKFKAKIDGGNGAGSYALDVWTADVNITKPLLSLGGTELPLNLSISYNKDRAKTMAVGNALTFMPSGWKFNCQQYVVVEGNLAYYIDGSYNVFAFTKALDCSNVYYENNGSGLVLTRVNYANNTIKEYTIDDGVANKLVFNADGVLIKVCADYGEEIVTTLTYEGDKLVKITDGVNRETNIDYSENEITISYQARSATLTMQNNLLTSVTDSMQATSTYTYDSNDVLASMKDCTNAIISFNNEGDFGRYQVVESVETTDGDVKTNAYECFNPNVEEIERIVRQKTYNVNGENSENVAISDLYVGYGFDEVNKLFLGSSECEPFAYGENDYTVLGEIIEQPGYPHKINTSDSTSEVQCILLGADDDYDSENGFELGEYKFKKIAETTLDFLSYVDRNSTDTFTLADYLATMQSKAKGTNYAWYNNKTAMKAIGNASVMVNLGAGAHNIETITMATVALSYDENNVATVTHATLYKVDNEILTQKVINENGEILSTTTYNIYALQTKQIDGKYNGVQYAYTSKGQLKKQYDVISGTEQLAKYYFYDEGNLVRVKPFEFSEATLAIFEYNEYGEMTSSTNQAGVVFEYDCEIGINGSDKITCGASFNKTCYTNGAVSELTNGETSFSYEYDELNRVQLVKVGDQQLMEMEYSTSGAKQNIKTTYANGYENLVTYDKYGRMLQLNEGDSVMCSCDYGNNANSKSKLLNYVDNYANKTYNYTYNDDGSTYIKNGDESFVEYTPADRLTTSKVYLANGNIESKTETTDKDDLHLGRTSTTKTSMLGQLYFNEWYTHDLLSSNGVLISRKSLLDGLQMDTSISYDSKARPSVVQRNNWFNSDNIFTDSQTYSYDDAGNISSVAIDIDTSQESVSYEYDELGRLTRENNSLLGTTYLYEYDINGNIISKNAYRYNAVEGFGNFKYSRSYIYNNTPWGDQLTSFNGKSCVYDELGNPTTYKGDTVEWKRGRLLSKYTPSGKYQKIFDYDANGMRIAKNSVSDDGSSTTFINYSVIGNRILQETRRKVEYGHADDIDTLTYIYDHSGILGVLHNGEVFKYVRNIFGDITHICSSTNSMLAKYVYDAWGNCKVCNPDGTENTSSTFIGNINPFRYRGYYYDVETGLYYLQSRYYDPETGRFINADTIDYLDPESINGLNLYAYCNNNPVMYVDSTGNYATGIQGLLTFGERFFIGLSELCRALTKIKPVYKSGVTKVGRAGSRAAYRASMEAFDETIALGKTFGKIARGIAFIGLGIEMGVSLFNNIKDGASFQAIAHDIVDIGASFAISWGITAAFTALIPIPFLGTAIGIGVSLLVDLAIDNSGGFVQVLTDAGNWIGDTAQSIGNSVSSAWSDFTSGWNKFWRFSWM